MTLKAQIISVLVLIVLVGSIVGATTYLVMAARQREAVATAKVEASQRIIDEKQKIIDDKGAAITKRDQEFTDWRSQHEREVQSITSASQAAAELNAKGLGLIARPAPTPSDPKAVEYIVPTDKLIPLYQSAAKCDEREHELDSCKADLTDTTAQLGAAQEVVKEKSKQADTWQQAAKGGSKAQRFFSGTKKVAIGAGAALGAVAIYLATHPRK